MLTHLLQVLLIDHGHTAVAQVQNALLRSEAPVAKLLCIEDLAAIDAALSGEAIDVILCLVPASSRDTAQAPDALMRLRSVLSSENLPPVIALIHACDEHELADEALGLGAEDYLTLDSLHRLPRTLVTVAHHRRLLNFRREPDTRHQLALTVLQGSTDGICVTDADARILLVNDAYARMSGYAQHELLGQTPRLLRSGKHDGAFYRTLWSTLREQGNWQGSITNRNKSGNDYDAWLRITAVHDEQGQVSHYIGQTGYASEQRQLIDRLHHMTRFDALTGLPNRSLFLDRLERSLASAQRSGRSVAVALIQLDRFRQINDTLGHAVGDQVLIDMARSFIRQIRQGDTLARLSGNEFSFLLGNLGAAEDALHLVSRLQKIIAEPQSYAGRTLNLTASIGISLYPKDGSNGDELLKAADTALIRARSNGGNCFNFYASDMDDNARRRLAIEVQLQQALTANELYLVYQPQNSLDDGAIIGAEALLRWQSHELGLVSPGEFIPVAEESGLIVPIGSWVLRQVCLQIAAWQAAGMPAVRVAVNVSARQFRGGYLADEVAGILAETGVSPELIELEITESALIHDLEAAISTSRQLKGLGIKLSLDDFGTGYSSLAYISRFPLDKLKIDQGFIRDITHNPANAAIATATVAIANSLNLSVLAEGVETENQALFLRERRCQAIQGYLFSRPILPAHFAELLASNTRLCLPASSADTATLLIVDDEEPVLAALKRVFRHEPYQLLTTRSTREAFELLARHKVQVVITDQRMLEMPGTEFFALLRQLHPATMRIILSGHTEADVIMDAINRGSVYKFLTKPWNDENLREQVREAFALATREAKIPERS